MLSIIRLLILYNRNTDYFIYVFALLLGIELIRIVDNDTAQPNLSATNVKLLASLPPLAEQQHFKAFKSILLLFDVLD